MKEISISLNGKKYDVKVGNITTSPVEIVVDGKSYQVEFEEKAGSQGSVPKPVATSTPAPARVVPVASPVAAAPAAGGNGVRAPMPGTIVSVDVKPGDKVARGQQVVSLEAMKMKNSIKSPVDATVKEVHVTNVQKVQYNDLLDSYE
jgi:biotin carboxyl carrier protein